MNVWRPYIASSRLLCSTNINVMWPLVPVVCVKGVEVRGYSVRVLVPYRIGSRPFCSTNGSTVSPLGPGHSWLLVCLDRSHLLLLMLRGLLLNKHTHKKKNVNSGTVGIKKQNRQINAPLNSSGHFRETLSHSDAFILLWWGWKCAEILHHTHTLCLFLYLVLLSDSSGFHSSVWLLAWGQSRSCGPWLPAPPPGNTSLLEPGRHSRRSCCTEGHEGTGRLYFSLHDVTDDTAEDLTLS